MCGIFCSICRIDHRDINNESNDWSLCKNNVNKRGPDFQSKHCEVINKKWKVEFAGSVLWMQGKEPVPQPCKDEEGNTLLWNGDIFSGPLENKQQSDTLTLMAELKSTDNIIKTLSQVKGPFSIIYLKKSTNLIYFGRDFIGRHSLLISVNPEHDSLTLSSVACKKIQNIIELPAVGIFSVNLGNSKMSLTCHPWKILNNQSIEIIDRLKNHFTIDVDIREPILTCTSVLEYALEPQPEDLHFFETLPISKHFQETMQLLLEYPEINDRVNHLLELLKNSIKVRVEKKPNYCKNCMQVIFEGINIECNHAKIGVLFSGGLDSAILAAIADQFVPENDTIDLINVAFEKVSKAPYINNKKNNKINNDLVEESKFDVPDRKTGREALKELEKIFPHRTWNFIECDVNREELLKLRSEEIGNLVYPLRTVLDESLGCAVWFASRAIGKVASSIVPYVSNCRILLLGMGADELFGGYTRHRTTLRQKGWKVLVQELDTELARISERNLGRDDRIVSDHGRQSRLPYLDEDFVNYVRSIPPWERCYPTEKMPQGLGDKLLLRLLAYKIGLQKTSTFPKRAFQFGSRIANSKENAKDVSNWL